MSAATQTVKVESPGGRLCLDCGLRPIDGKTNAARFCRDCQERHRHAGLKRAAPFRRKYPSNDQIDRVIREHYNRRLTNGGRPRSLPTCAEIGKRIGWPKHRVTSRAGELGLARVKEKPWSEVELLLLEQLAHFVPSTIVKRFCGRGFQRSANAIKIKLTRLGLKSASDYYSATVCSKLFGVDIHDVSRWIRAGYLKAKRKETERSEIQGGDPYLINDIWVRAFVQAHPTEFDVRKVDQMWFLNLVFDGKLAGSLYSR